MKSYAVAAKTRHFEALARLAKATSPEQFKNPSDFEIGQSLYRRLRPLENRMRRAALSYCDDYNYGEDRLESMKEQTRAAVARLFGGELPRGFKINSDPRGYALKIDMEELTDQERDNLRGIHRDFGGYGILAPEEF